MKATPPKKNKFEGKENLQLQRVGIEIIIDVDGFMPKISWKWRVLLVPSSNNNYLLQIETAGIEKSLTHLSLHQPSAFSLTTSCTLESAKQYVPIKYLTQDNNV